jgi:protein PsiE
MKNNKNFMHFLIGRAEQLLLLVIAIATLGATVIELARIIGVMSVDLSDLFLLFIYAEVLGMVGVFYKENRIPVTLPIIIAITALTRLIVLNTKGLDGINILYEASGILLLSVAAYVMSKKEELSIKKLTEKIRNEMPN